jgi:hypothetical protein
VQRQGVKEEGNVLIRQYADVLMEGKSKYASEQQLEKNLQSITPKSPVEMPDKPKGSSKV